MKQLLTITGMFNDELTNYQDKISSVSMVVDVDKDCECTRHKACAICKLVRRGVLTEYIDQMKDPQLITKVVHSKNKEAYNIIGVTLGKKHKIATIPYEVDDKGQFKQESFDHAEFISECFNNSIQICEMLNIKK